MFTRILYALIALILPAVLFTGCAQMRAFEKKTSYLTVSSQEETAMGAQYASELSSTLPMINDAAAQQWLEKVGASLAANSPTTEQQFRFSFVNDMSVNAFAIPGGSCYVNRGLVEFVDNEAQLIAVIGHEINHVTQRHGISRMQRQMALQLAGQAAAATAKSPEGAQLASTAVNASGFLASRQFSQADESEADALGVEAMYKSGWDPREAASLWEKMAAASGGQPPFWLEQMMSTHPSSPKRRSDILAMCAKLDLTSRPLKKDSPEFQAMKARFQKLPKPAAPAAAK